MNRSTKRGAGVLALLLAAGSAWPATDDDLTCANDSGEPAIEACNRAINGGRISGHALAQAYYNRGVEYYNKKDYDRSISDYNQALRIRSDYALAYAGRGNAWSAKKELKRAMDDYDQALIYDPQLASAYTGRGMDRQTLNDIAGARADYRAALASPQRYGNDKWAHDTARERLKQFGD